MPPKGSTGTTKAKKVAVKKATGPKKSSAYNMFMKTEVPRVKKETPNMDHKEAFKQAAANWGSSKENPKNK